MALSCLPLPLPLPNTRIREKGMLHSKPDTQNTCLLRHLRFIQILINWIGLENIQVAGKYYVNPRNAVTQRHNPSHENPGKNG